MSKQDFGCGYSTKELTGSRDKKPTKLLEGNLSKRIKNKNKTTKILLI